MQKIKRKPHTSPRSRRRAKTICQKQHKNYVKGAFMGYTGYIALYFMASHNGT